MRQYKNRTYNAVKNQGRLRGKKSWKNRSSEFIKRYYYDEEKPRYKSKLWDFDYILNIIAIFVGISLIALMIYLLCNMFYKIGYDHKVKEEYDLMYRVVRQDVYYEGYIEGLSVVKTDGIERKTKLIAAYNSLIRYENLSEIDQKAFTYRLNELLRSPVPEEEKVEKFIEDVQEILSSDT